MGPLLRWLELRLPWARCALECLGPRLPWQYGWSCNGHRLRVSWGALHQSVLAGTAITGMSTGGDPALRGESGAGVRLGSQ